MIGVNESEQIATTDKVNAPGKGWVGHSVVKDTRRSKTQEVDPSSMNHRASRKQGQLVTRSQLKQVTRSARNGVGNCRIQLHCFTLSR